MGRAIQLFRRARNHGDRIAIRSADGERTYRDILDHAADMAAVLLDGAKDLEEARVAYLIPVGFDYITTQWGIWQAGAVAVPVSLSATEPELEYTLTDSEVSVVIAAGRLVDTIKPSCDRLNVRLIDLSQVPVPKTRTLPKLDVLRRAMVLYTSGTTSKPKGVVSTHANIQSQIETLVTAWRWAGTDSIPLFLPLHHIHGIINVMSCALWAGATIEPFPRFDIQTILGRIADGAYSIFMAVPTIYVKLIQELESQPLEARSSMIEGFAKMRLMVSGSAALPASVHEKWLELTGQELLERYGMTEIGMALSNPYDGQRRPGAVGQPLPSVELRLISEHGKIVAAEGEPSEIQIRGPSVFKEYWNRPQVTSDSFENGWFRTGDMAVFEDGYYRIMGRQSVDIIKSGGYKLSALEIEATLLDYAKIKECAVVGLADATWGESVAVACVLVEGSKLNLDELRDWCDGRLSKYKIPKRMLVVEGLPRNAMGKVMKPAVRKLFDSSFD